MCFLVLLDYSHRVQRFEMVNQSFDAAEGMREPKVFDRRVDQSVHSFEKQLLVHSELKFIGSFGRHEACCAGRSWAQPLLVDFIPRFFKNLRAACFSMSMSCNS